MTAILLAVAAVVSLSPSTWAEGDGSTGVRTASLDDLVRPPTARSAAYLDGRPHEFRDGFPVGDAVRDAGQPDGEASAVRMVRAATTLSGRARAIDGDTLELSGARIRLYGIDAPESAQRCRAEGRSWACGREATRALARQVRGKRVACEAHDRDRYDRIVAVCTAAGQDLNAWMVAEG